MPQLRSQTPVEEYDQHRVRRRRIVHRWLVGLGLLWLAGQACGAALVLTEGIAWKNFGPFSAWMDLIWTLAFCGFLSSGVAAFVAGLIAICNWSLLSPARIALGLVPWAVVCGLGALFLFAVFF